MALPAWTVNLALDRPPMGVGHLHVGPPARLVGFMNSDWRDLAACIGKPELFYTDKHLYEAQQICGTCPVTAQCRTARRQYEQVAGVAHPGIWAGEYWAIRSGLNYPRRARKIL